MSTTMKRHVLPHVHFFGEVIYEAVHNGEVFEINGPPGMKYAVFSFGRPHMFATFETAEEAQAYIDPMLSPEFIEGIRQTNPASAESFLNSVTSVEIRAMEEPKTDYPARPWPEGASIPEWARDVVDDSGYPI